MKAFLLGLAVGHYWRATGYILLVAIAALLAIADGAVSFIEGFISAFKP